MLIIFLKTCEEFLMENGCWNISRKYTFLSVYKINVKVTRWICTWKGSHHKRQSRSMVAFIGAFFHPKFLSYHIAQMIPSQRVHHSIFFPGAQHSAKSHKFCKQQGWNYHSLDILVSKWEVTLKTCLLYKCMIYSAVKNFQTQCRIVNCLHAGMQTNKTCYGRLVSHSLNLCSFPSRQTSK